jgi:hypothetical protein
MIETNPLAVGNRRRRSIALHADLMQRSIAWVRRSIARKGSPDMGGNLIARIARHLVVPTRTVN